MSQPAAAMAGPPTPVNKHRRRALSACMSPAANWSPEDSPATNATRNSADTVTAPA